MIAWLCCLMIAIGVVVGSYVKHHEIFGNNLVMSRPELDMLVCQVRQEMVDLAFEELEEYIRSMTQLEYETVVYKMTFPDLDCYKYWR